MTKEKPKAQAEPDLTAFYERHPPNLFPNFADASLSASRAIAMIAPDILSTGLLPLDEVDEPHLDFDYSFGYLITYFKEDGAWLKGCRKRIISAIEAGNETFFVELAACRT